jgi:threonine/homoserine/homoserine lactone efflux protein
LGLSSAKDASGEIRIGFRRGWMRTLVITLGGAGFLSLVAGGLTLADHQPIPVFQLLQQWGFW